MGPAIAVLRVFWGLVFCSNGLAKLVPGLGHLPGGFFLIDSEGARNIMVHLTRNHPVGLYRDLVSGVLVPNWRLVGPMVGAVELATGLLLMVGLAAPLAALVAALLALHLQFAALGSGTWLFEYAVEWVGLLCLAAMHPGRFHGLDAILWTRHPRLRAVFA